MVKKLKKDVMGMTVAGIGLGVGATAAGATGISPAGFTAGAEMMGPLGTTVGASAVMRQMKGMGNLAKKKRRRRR